MSSPPESAGNPSNGHDAHTPTEEDSKAASILKERRFKLSRACDRCRRRRIKCDEGHPCQACLASGAACTFEEPGKRTHPHKSKRTATLEDRMHHLESLIQAIPPAVFAAVPTSPHAAHSYSPTLPTSVPPSAMPQMPTGGFVGAGIPPPSLHVFPLTNPSTHFAGPASAGPYSAGAMQGADPVDHLVGDMGRMSISSSYFYFDDEGYARWQGETSGFPLLDFIMERTPQSQASSSPRQDSNGNGVSDHDMNGLGEGGRDRARKTVEAAANNVYFPDRSPRRAEVHPETLWRLITQYIVPDLMDSLVQCYLSTSYYIMPFLHLPSFLADYGSPSKWGEPGFAAFIVAICCLASRHIDDPRVRADPSSGISAGKQWFDLFFRLRTLPMADCPTLYTIQADLIAGVYAVGLGRLSRGAALLTEAATVCVDAGLHRGVGETYDVFDPVELEVRKRTFWCVYIWDKQLSAHFGRPPMLRLRDCDVGEPAMVDDEFITREGMGSQPPGTESRMAAFVCTLRIMTVLESIVDVPPARPAEPASTNFLARAAATLSGARRSRDFREELALLDEIHSSMPQHWAHSPETLASDDVIRVTQAERLHCAEQFVRLLIHRHLFGEIIMARQLDGDVGGVQGELEREVMASAQSAALQIVGTYLHIASKGLMTYYGVHVIHQCTQAGRTLMAILLNCNSSTTQYLISPSLEALRSCVGLLRRFSGRYVCGIRSGDLLEEFCRLTQIPLENVSRPESLDAQLRPAWVRPIRKKTFSGTSHPGTHGRSSQSPAASSDSGHGNGNGRGFSPSGDTFSGSEFFTDPSFGMQMDPVPPENGNGIGVGGQQGMGSFLNTADVMSFLNDPMVDLGSMFPSGVFDPNIHAANVNGGTPGVGPGGGDSMFGGGDIGIVRKLSVGSP